MAILIPSKNIYGDIDYSIERNNIINTVVGNVPNISLQEDFDVTIAKRTIEASSASEDFTQQENFNWAHKSENLSGQVSYSAVYGAYIGKRSLFSVDVYIPKVYNGKIVSSVDTKFNTIEVKLFGYTKKGRSTATLNTSNGSITNLVFETLYETSENQELTLPSSITVSTTWDNSLKTTVNLESTTDRNIQLDTEISGGNEFYKLTINRLMVGFTTLEMSGITRQSVLPSSLYISGYYTIYVPQTVQLSFEGDTITVNLAEKNREYYNNYIADTLKFGKKTFELQGSEIMQSGATVGEENAFDNLAKRIITAYKNGKETIVINCSVSDYYEYDKNATNNKGKKVIDITNSDKMLFSIGDIVVPMFPSKQGVDEPLSTTKDGNAKEFYVVGNSIYYDGAVMQKIYLQEL